MPEHFSSFHATVLISLRILGVKALLYAFFGCFLLCSLERSDETLPVAQIVDLLLLDLNFNTHDVSSGLLLFPAVTKEIIILHI